LVAQAVSEVHNNRATTTPHPDLIVLVVAAAAVAEGVGLGDNKKQTIQRVGYRSSSKAPI
jgi:hypothetical protein